MSDMYNKSKMTSNALETANESDPVPSSPIETQDVVKSPAIRDPQVIRVRGGDPADTDPKKRPTIPSSLSRSILHVLKDFDWVDLESVGPRALSGVCEAFRLSDIEVTKRAAGVVLVMRQKEYAADIGGRMTRGIRTRIFAIPIKEAR